LTAQAIVKNDRGLLLRALCTDPLTNSIPDAKEMIEEVLREEKEALSPEWFAGCGK
jgi:alpha-galactosidase/6-phospho-beta-glucosidase family protein